MLTQLTGTDSEAAAYEFTTLTCIPGVIHYNDAKIQLLVWCFCLLAFIEPQGAHVVSIEQPHPLLQTDRPNGLSG